MAKNTELKSALEEYEAFIANYVLVKVSNNSKRKTELQSIFKRYFSFLIWYYYIQSNRISPRHFPRKFKTYFVESASDVCQSLLLWNQGLYKPALLILRSGVENLFRAILLLNGVKLKGISTVFQLIASLKALTKDTESHALIVSLAAQYESLCGDVHSNARANMSLTAAAGVYPRYRHASSQRFSKLFTNICRDIIALLSLQLKTQINRMHHRHRDLLFDSLPKKVKVLIHT